MAIFKLKRQPEPSGDARKVTPETDDALGEPVNELESEEETDRADDESTATEEEAQTENEASSDEEGSYATEAEQADVEGVSLEESDASFALSNDADSLLSSEDDEPARRASTNRRRSSIKKRSPVKKGVVSSSSAVVTSPALAKKVGSGMKRIVPTLSSSKGRIAEVPSPILRERAGQDADVLSGPTEHEEDEDILPLAKTPKKKRSVLLRDNIAWKTG